MVFRGLSAHVEGCRVAGVLLLGHLAAEAHCGEASTFGLQGERCFLPPLQGVMVDAEGGWRTLQICLKMLHLQTGALPLGVEAQQL